MFAAIAPGEASFLHFAIGEKVVAFEKDEGPHHHHYYYYHYYYYYY